MAYTRHHWVCGETVTAELLNNIEDGIEEALACCGGGDEDYSADCERTDLGNLVGCGLMADAINDFQNWADTSLLGSVDDITTNTFTAIINGVEITGETTEDAPLNVDFFSECGSWALWGDKDAELDPPTETWSSGEFMLNTDSPCGQAWKEADDDGTLHVALYCKINS